VDVQPNYVRVTIKGKILQLVLPCEVFTDRSVAQRNIITGGLLVIMPRIQKLAKLVNPLFFSNQRNKKYTKKLSIRASTEATKRELLEIGPPTQIFEDLLKIVNGKKKSQEKIIEKNEDFNDDPSVPPLE
jgi:protein TilB